MSGLEQTTPSASNALPGPGAASDIHIEPQTPLSGEIGTGRVASLGQIVRRSADNLRAGADRELADIAAQVKEAVNGSEFATLLERTLTNRLPTKLQQALVTTDGSAAIPVEAFRKLVHDIADAGVAHFQLQRDGGTLTGARMTVDTLFGSAKITKEALQAFCAAHIPDAKHHQAFTGQIRPLLADITGATLVVTGQTLRERGGEQGIVYVSSLGLSYLERPEIAATEKQRADPKQKTKPQDAKKPADGDGRRDPEVRDAIRLGHAAQTQDLNRVGEFLLAVESIPRMPVTELRDLVAGQATRRMQRAIAELLVRHPEDKIGPEHFKTIDVFKEMYGRADVRFHPYKGDNDAAIVDAIYNGLKAGHMTLSVVSCPDYSGSIQNDPATGKPYWVYDFKSLGSDTGSVAKRGFDYVNAWHQVLSRPEYLGTNVSVVHWEATFEIASGFKSHTSDHSGDLSYEDAVERLRASGEAVKRLYAASGINIESRLTRESIPDEAFKQRKAELGHTLREQAASNPALKDLMEEIARGRKVLYQEWYPPTEGEGADEYQRRIAEVIVPENIAEYILLGEILCGAGENTLVLAYDSPKMGETYALRQLAIVSGQGANALNYAGA